MEALMSEIQIEIDDAVLADAARMFGTKTNEETVSSAVQDAAQRVRRRQAFERLGKMGRAGDFDLLLDKRNYRK
jgi:Arc/MetJ family transcription regulator